MRTTGSPSSSWVPALMLVALAVAGQAAALSLIDAPRFSVFQHFRTWHALIESGPRVSIACLIVQAVVCFTLAFRERHEFARSLASLAPRWALVIAAGVLLFSASIPTQSIGRWLGELTLSVGIMTVAILNLVLAVRAMPGDRLERLFARLQRAVTVSPGAEELRPWDARLPWIVAAWVLVVTAAIAVVVFERLPHIDDDVTSLFQAKYMSAGRLWLDRPPDPAVFAVNHTIVDGTKWYGKFFPGWPATLALGVLGGVPWLVNPLLAAGSILLAHSLVRRLYDRATAHAAAVLLGASPWLLFLSASYMAHTASLFWTLLALVGIQRQREGGRVLVWAVVAGVSLGMLFLTRPFDAALLGPVAGLWALGMGGKRLPFHSLMTTGLTAMLVASVYFAYNSALTGDPMLPPHRLWADKMFGPGVDVFGFGPGVGIPLWQDADPLPGHHLADVVLNANKNFALTNFELFGWAAGSLILVWLPLVRRRVGPADVFMLAILVAVIGGHSFYWAPGGPDFGARYWYLIIIPLVVLTVRGAQEAVSRLATADDDHGAVAARCAAFVVVATVSALVTVLPWRSAGKYHHYREIGSEMRTIAARRGIENALVFVRSPRRTDYQSAFSLNPPTLDEPGNIYVADRGNDSRALTVKHFSGRRVWVIGRTTETDPELQVFEGPLAPGMTPVGQPAAVEDSLVAVIR